MPRDQDKLIVCKNVLQICTIKSPVEMNLYHLFVLFIVSIKFFGYSVFRHSVLDQMHFGVMAVDLLVKLQKLTLFVNTSKSSWGVRSRLYKPPISGDEATSQIVLKSAKRSLFALAKCHTLCRHSQWLCLPWPLGVNKV